MSLCELRTAGSSGEPEPLLLSSRTFWISVHISFSPHLHRRFFKDSAWPFPPHLFPKPSLLNAGHLVAPES